MPNEMKVVIDGYDDVLKEIQSMKAKSERVVNRTVADFKSRGPGWVASEIMEEYNVKRKDINEAKKGVIKGKSKVKIKGDKLDDLSVLYRGRLLTPTHFSMKPTMRPSKNRPYVVSAEIKHSNGRVALGSRVFLGKSGKEGSRQIPFQRKGEEQYPIVSIKSVSVPQMITNEAVAENIQVQINEGLGKRLEHHLKQALK
ncbi:MAG: phage tail protein [Eubacterium sp.]|nr:phage tail protein [Eubacterium sp.]